MEVTIHHGKTPLSITDEAQVRQRVHSAFDRLNSHIRSVEVRLADLNGPRGGIDKRCTMEAILPRHGTLVVEARHADAVAAATEAAKRLSRRVADASERSRDLRRRAAVQTIETTTAGGNGGTQ